MRLYHYLEAKWALDDIRRRRLKTSRIDDMNDPYEFKTVHSNHEASKLALETTDKHAIRKYGVLCFSRSRNNILMWGHYGDRHKGICLGFDVANEIKRDVDYVDEVLSVGDITYSDDTTRASNREGYQKIIDRSFWGKYRGWNYEEEVRMHGERAEVDEETGLYFVDFSERLKLKEVITGPRFPMSKRPIEAALTGYLENVKIATAVASAERFEIMIDESGFDGSGA